MVSRTRKTIFYQGVGVGRDGNVEHEQSGFMWGLDNWIYSTYNAFRFRWTPPAILREPTAPNGAPVGPDQDDDGKMWFVNARARARTGQLPVADSVRRAAASTDGFEPGFDTVWPLAGVGDMQGGMRRVRMPLGAAQPLHGDGRRGYRPRRPTARRICVGDLLFAEPVGRLIRRAKIVKTEGLTQLRNAYPGSEFILGTDPLFRPVNMKTGARRHRVHRRHVPRHHSGSAVDARAARICARRSSSISSTRSSSHGRIWRLRFDGAGSWHAAGRPAGESRRSRRCRRSQPDLTQPRMLSETPAQLVAHLTHPNGWWRDMAQRLLVLKQDKSVVPALQTMARRPPTPPRAVPRAVDARGARRARRRARPRSAERSEPEMRVQAIRAERDAVQGRRHVRSRRTTAQQRRTPTRTSRSRRC